MFPVKIIMKSMMNFSDLDTEKQEHKSLNIHDNVEELNDINDIKDCVLQELSNQSNESNESNENVVEVSVN